MSDKPATAVLASISLDRFLCLVCRQVYDRSQFSARRPNPKRHDYRPVQYWCKACVRAYRFGRREIEREQDRARRRK